jgi:hypothetical protein
MKYGPEDLAEVYETETRRIVAECEFTTELVGGQPGDEKAIRAFVAHHLGIPAGTEDHEQAVKRILKHEVGKRETTPDTGEVREEEVYGVNVIRRDETGPWLGNWMAKAALKAASSRLGLFRTKGKIGAKGDMAEMGRVIGTGKSAGPTPTPERIYLYRADGGKVETVYKTFMGRVNTPQGAKSIVHHSEVAPPGTRFAFELRVPFDRLTEQDLMRVFAYVGQIGLGSAKALERGKFKVLSLDIEEDRKRARKEDVAEATA